MAIVAGDITVDPERSASATSRAPLALSKRLSGQPAASALASWPTCSTPAASTSLRSGVASGRQNLPPTAPDKQRSGMLSASVAEYDIADVRPMFGKGRA